MNKAILMGRLGKHPEIRATQNGHTVATFSLAVDRPKRHDREKETDWLRIVVWGKLAEIAERYLTQGSKVLVTAAVRTRKYQDKTGKDAWITEFVAESIEFCESKAKDTAGDTANYDVDAIAVQIVDDFPEYGGNAEDIPF